MKLEALVKPLHEMSYEELLDHVHFIRNDRRLRKTVPGKKKVTKDAAARVKGHKALTALESQISGMSKEQRLELLKMLEGG